MARSGGHFRVLIAGDVDKRGPLPPAVTPGETEPEARDASPTWVVCNACGARITLSASAVGVQGAHQHEFTNPSAITFVVRCFSTAPGCLPVGERSTEWTWFPGYAWQIEVCRACTTHLGWSFHGKRRFYGLIRDRIGES